MYEFTQTHNGKLMRGLRLERTHLHICMYHSHTRVCYFSPLNYNSLRHSFQIPHRSIEARGPFSSTHRQTQRRRACSTSASRGPTSTPPARCRRTNKELSGSHYKDESHFSISLRVPPLSLLFISPPLVTCHPLFYYLFQLFRLLMFPFAHTHKGR